MAARMYRIGDYVYCDDVVSSNGGQPSNEPYQIRRIEELFKTPYGNGGVEARVVCFYRRKDISTTLVGMLDRQMLTQSEEDETDSNYSDGVSVVEATISAFQSDYSDLMPEEKYYLKHREVFLSRQMESIPATCIRGKCQVNYFNSSAETYKSYLCSDNTFFYRYIYDPQQRTLSSDRGEVRIGSSHQADVPEVLVDPKYDEIEEETREQLIWSPNINPLPDKEIDQVLLLARSVGTFARALDCSGNSVRSMDWSRSSGLHMSAAAACRDITLFHAMNCLHQNNYDIGKAVLSLVPGSGPVLCRDELEDWSASEAFLFEESLEKYGKDFQIIRKEVLPWKSIKSIIEYYYMWKTTDRYSQRKRTKAVSNDGSSNKLKQVFIPPYSKPPPQQFNIDNKRTPVICDSCFAQHSQRWYKCLSSSILLASNYNAQNSLNINGVLCDDCYKYWKHYGGLSWKHISSTQTNNAIAPISSTQRTLLQRCPECDKELRGRHQLNRHMSFAHGQFKRKVNTSIHQANDNERVRDSFCLFVTRRTKLARILCQNIIQLRKLWKNNECLNLTLLETELSQKSSEDLKLAEMKLLKLTNEKHPAMNTLKPKDVRECSQLAFPKMSHDALAAFFSSLEEFSYPSKCMKRPKLLRRNTCLPNCSHSSIYLHNNRTVNNFDPQSTSHELNSVNRHFPKVFDSLDINYIDGADGIYVIATRTHKQTRKQIPVDVIRKAARYPWKAVKRYMDEHISKKSMHH